MRLLDRYLLRELLVPLSYCLAGFLMFWISFDLFNELNGFQEKKLQPADIAEYYIVKTPELLVVVVPIALLLALLYTLTNHARHNEITAIRAAGVSLWRLSATYFGVGLAASAALFALNELWVPDSALRTEQIKRRHVPVDPNGNERGKVRNLGFKNARYEREWLIGLYNVETAEMFSVQVTETLRNGLVRSMSAARGGRTNGVWIFSEVREFRHDPRTKAAPVPTLHTNVLARPEFLETPDEIRSEIKIASRISLPGAREADVPLVELFDYLHFHPNLTPADRWWLYTKMHGRLAAPWTCLVVVLIALPFGAASGRRNVFVGVASSIFIAFAFFVLSQLSLALGTGGYLPAWLAGWLPNLVFGGTGLWLTARVR